MITLAPVFAQRAPLFKSEVQPVLEKSCVQCHNPSQKMGSLDLSSFAGKMEGSASGPVIAPGLPQRSMLWKMIEKDQMPQTYIEQGRFPNAKIDEAAAAREAAKIAPEARNWSSFRKPVKVAPKIQNKVW